LPLKGIKRYPGEQTSKDIHVKKLFFALPALLIMALASFAQDAPANPISASEKGFYGYAADERH
jgi:hypothetical protein